MAYKMEQYEICLLQSINCQLDSLYSDDIAAELREILLRAISSGQIEDEQIKRLKELLVQFDSSSLSDSLSNDEDVDFYAEWPEWQAIDNANIKRKTMYLHHRLSNWLLIQYAVYQKQLIHKPSVDKVLDSIIGIDREY